MKVVIRIFAGVLVAALIAVAAAGVVVQSGWFHEYVRQRIISELERATGARVELGRFSFRGSTLMARVAPLVLHGKESPGESPLFSAEEVALGLRIISIWDGKIDLASLRVEKPRLRIVLYPDGSTNLPDPLVRDPGHWAQELIHLAVRRYEIADGLLEYDNHKIPLNTRGDGLELRMSYDRRTPAYRGELHTRGVWLMFDDYGPIQAQASAQFAIERSRVVLSHAEFSTGKSRVELSGELDDPRRPRGSFHVKANTSAGELVKTFSLPIETAGRAAFEGVLNVAFSDGFRFAFDGSASARGVGYVTNRWKLEGMDLSANVSARPGRISFKNIQASASGTSFMGSATLEERSKLRVEGNVNNLTVAQAAKLVTDRAMPLWSEVMSGVMSGEVTLAATLGQSDAKACVNFSVSPAESYAGSDAAARTTGLTGTIHATYDEAGQDISFDPVVLANGFTRIEASGTLDKSVQVRLHSTRLEDLSPALAMLAPALPQQLPLQLNNGVLDASGTVTGRLDNPSFQGQASVTNGILKGHAFDRFSSDFTATPTSVSASRFTLGRGATEVTGSGSLSGGFQNGTLAAQATVRNANLQELAREAGSSLAIAGMANASLRISGSLRAPQAEIALDVQNPVAFGEQLDRVRANLRLTADSLEGGLQPPLTKKTGFSLASIDVSDGQAQDGPGRFQFSGAYRRTGADWRTGAAQIQLAAQNLPARQIDRLHQIAPRLNGLLNADVRGRLQLDRGRIELTSAEGNVSAQTVTLDGQPLGEIALSGGTTGSNASMAITGKLRGVAFDGQGSWKLEGDEPGSVNVRFAPLSVDLLHKLAMLTGAGPSGGGDLPFDGVVQGRAGVSIALERPRDFQAQLTLDTVELDPKANQAKRLGVPPQDITIKNSQPVVVALTAREARIVSAKFAAPGIGNVTSLEARGMVPFGSGGGANITLSGSVNLIALQLLNPNLLAKGAADVQASVQGALANPALTGRLELKNASLYLSGVPNGLDNANGVVHFDRNRAIVDQLIARTGGGTVAFGGFIEFGQVLTYRLQARAQQVRVAYPEGLSNSFGADLALTGTSDASTLSGTITMDRTVIDPNIDLAPLLAASQRPVPENATPNDYLHGMQFNLRIQGAPRYELDTALTRDVQAAADLRLRGTPARPVLLGTIDVNQGEIALPGSRYTIDRGEISFVNQVRIEPILDMQLETKARGTSVTIGIRGPLNKPNVRWSSDPPLRESEIIALLAVGRTPTATDLSPSGQPTSGLSGLASGDMLGQALSDQMSSRFQRFFGASGVKIDPTMTGVENLPQARLTWEEQVSKEVTFTYITNLNRTQEQIVRVEWDFDKSWSAVAVRDANGLFGIDFQYRKRFK